MNIITDILPDSIEYCGKTYPLRTDFKVWLKFHSIVTDKKRTPAEKSTDAILCCFDSKRCKRLPDTVADTMAVLLQFFSACTKEERGKNIPKSDKVFDFTEDAEYIYSSFFQEYGIDLAKSSMHWYRFLALLNGLSENTKLRKIIAWRGVNLSDIKDPKMRSFYHSMKSLYRLSGANKALTEGNIASELSRAF